MLVVVAAGPGRRRRCTRRRCSHRQLQLYPALDTFAVLEQKSLADGLWWATVTSLTIGYGDLTPVTPAGRIVGILFGHFWIFIVIPMIVANIIMHLVEDKHLFSDEEQRELMQRLKRIEARLTQQEQDHTRS